jgi:cleavage stimulation factor subunit 2
MAPGGLPPLPQGKERPAGVTSTDAISRTLNTRPPAQLLDVLQQMRTLATTDPARCAELLNLAPQLSYAVFQAMLLMGLVSPDAINSVLETPIAVPPPAAAVAAPPYGYNPAPVPTPPYGAGQGYAPPPAAAPAPAAAQEGLGDIIDALLKLTPEEINSLNPEDREQVLAILAAHGR